MQIFQARKDLPQNLLYFKRSHLVERTIDELQEIAVHQVKTEIDDGGFVVSTFFVDYLFDVQDVLVAQSLQNFDLTDSCDGKAHLVFVFEVLHLLQGIEFVICEIAGFVDRAIGSVA
jgi:hypothetical protein